MMIKIEAIDLEVMLPADVWDEIEADLSAWNENMFPGRPVWVELTRDEAVAVLGYFDLQPFVRGLTVKGREGWVMSFHVALTRVERRAGSGQIRRAKIREERMAVTMSQGDVVFFTNLDALPKVVARVCGERLKSSRKSAEFEVEKLVSDYEASQRVGRVY